MQWWEVPVKTREDGRYDYNNDCTVTVVQKTSEPNKWKEFGYFQDIIMQGPDGQGYAGKIFYKMEETHLFLVDEDLNKEIACRIKKAPDTSPKAVGGFRYTIMFNTGFTATQKSTAASAGTSGSYSPPKTGGRDFDKEAMGKCYTLYVAALLGREGGPLPSVLEKQPEELMSLWRIAANSIYEAPGKEILEPPI